MLPELHSKPLRHWIESGVPIIATYPSGASAGSWKDHANYCRDLDTLVRHWRAGIRRFQYLPEAAGLLVLDLDRKNGKDGLRELLRYFTSASVVLPDYLQDVERFPCWVGSPTGGCT